MPLQVGPAASRAGAGRSLTAGCWSRAQVLEPAQQAEQGGQQQLPGVQERQG